MGGKSKSQTVGYHYYAGVMAVIGGVIERLVNIRPNDGNRALDRPIIKAVLSTLTKPTSSKQYAQTRIHPDHSPNNFAY